MKTSQIIKEHPSIVHPGDMHDVCKPLQKLGVTYFSHARINDKGELAINASNPEFLANYYNQEFYNFDLHLAKKLPESSHVLWDLVTRLDKTEELYQMGVTFGLTHTFTIIETKENEKNYYHFATKPGNNFMNTFFIQHIDLLEKFITYFKDHLLINDRLNRTYKMTCETSPDKGGYLIKEGISTALHETDINEFLHKIGMKHALKNSEQSQIELARRERQCAFYLLQGNTSKEIADLLHISTRTVEVYFERLKVRFGSKNKIQLARHLVEAKIFLEE